MTGSQASGTDVFARGDAIARRYLLGYLDGDELAQWLALAEVHDSAELWDLVDALGAAFRDVLDLLGELDVIRDGERLGLDVAARARVLLRADLLGAARARARDGGDNGTSPGGVS